MKKISQEFTIDQDAISSVENPTRFKRDSSEQVEISQELKVLSMTELKRRLMEKRKEYLYGVEAYLTPAQAAGKEAGSISFEKSFSALSAAQGAVENISHSQQELGTRVKAITRDMKEAELMLKKRNKLRQEINELRAAIQAKKEAIKEEEEIELSPEDVEGIEEAA